MNLIPLPNGGRPGAETYIDSAPVTTRQPETSIRLDQNLNSTLRATFRFTHDSSEQVIPFPFFGGGSFPAVGTKITVPGLSLVARLIANTSKSTVNEFVFSYTTDHFSGANLGNWHRPEE